MNVFVLVSMLATAFLAHYNAPKFFKELAPIITPRTVLGIDANCVPDVHLDVKRDPDVTSPYENSGSDECEDMDECGLPSD